MGALYSILQGEKPQSNENNIIIFFKQQRVMIKDWFCEYMFVFKCLWKS